VNGGGKKELEGMNQDAYYRKVIRDTEGLYQLLCANCNWIKRVLKQEVLQNRSMTWITS
jgi:hypothetical protein